MDALVDVDVEFPYTAEQPDELTIKVGDVIRNVVMEDGGWWEGELNGKKGMFPDNFVKVRKAPEKEAPKKDEAKKDEGKKKAVEATKRQSVKDLANKLKLGQEGPPMMKRKDTNTKKKRAKCVFTYEPEQEDELKLDIGDIIDVLRQEEEGWWEGIANGRQGMFPSNFVEIIEEGDSTTDTAVENTEERMIKGKKVQGVGLGNIFNDGPIKLRKTGNSQEQQPPPKAEKREEPAVRKPKDTKPVEKAVVRYSYVGEHEDELSLTEGEILNILDKELEDSGWWRGELNGRIGVFPDNFVELIKEELSDKASRSMVTPAPQPKPKKPPPPVQPAQPAQPAPSKPGPPKLPEKGPVISAEQPKPEPEKEEKPAPVQPSLPSKKPIFPPPPLTKKPTKTIDPKDLETKDDGKHGFEVVEPTSDKLVHLTATRPKGPTKRPPSQDDERNGDVKEIHEKPVPTKADKPDRPEPVPTKADKPDRADMVGGKTAPVSRPSEPPASSGRISDGSHLPQVNSHLQSAIDDLHKEFKELKANTVSKTAFNELKSENEHLKQELESVKTQYSKRFRDIMQEIDEEKKIRLSTQVEMERIRKLVAESHV